MAPQLSPNLILYRQLHQPQMDQDLENMNFTEPKTDTLPHQMVATRSQMIPPHLLSSPEKISTMLSPLATSTHQTEGNECSTIEKDNETTNPIDLKSPQSKIKGFEPRDPISLLEKCYSFRDLGSSFTNQQNCQIENMNNAIDETSNENELIRLKQTVDTKDDLNRHNMSPQMGFQAAEI